MEQLIQQLKVILGTNFGLYFKAHSFHWNVEGPNFPQYHSFLNDFYDSVFDQTDGVDGVVVQGDTTSTFAGALAGYYRQIPVAHVEAGLRTSSIYSPFPEEGHRRMISRITTVHLCATEQNYETLLSEGTERKQMHVVGNTVLDALAQTVERQNIDITQSIPNTVLVTLHRRENFNTNMQSALEAINYLTTVMKVDVHFPMHPNPNLRDLASKTLMHNNHLHVSEPLGYVDFVKLMTQCRVILTDSGGIQEEAPFLGRPVLVLRDDTERTESLDTGSAELVGFDRELIIDRTVDLLDQPCIERDYSYGDGQAAQRICDILARL